MAATDDKTDASEDLGCAIFIGIAFVMLGIGHIWSAAYGFLAGGIAILLLALAAILRSRS